MLKITRKHFLWAVVAEYVMFSVFVWVYAFRMGMFNIPFCLSNSLLLSVIYAHWSEI